MPSQMVRAHPELPEPTPQDTAWIASFLRALNSRTDRPAAANTKNVYRLAVRLLARWARSAGRGRLAELTRVDIQDYVTWMRTEARKRDGQPFSEGYVNNQFRALQSFYAWMADEEDDITNPMTKLPAPKCTAKVVPVVADEDWALLIKGLEKAKDFDSRRDLAILRMFMSSGLRIEELTLIELDAIDLDRLRVTVLGKGNKERTVRFNAATGTAIDRYLRVRAKHRFATENTRLWLPTPHRRRPLTTNGIRCMVRRRAAAVGLRIHPHMFRHTFSSKFLENGGEQGDLMELNGWSTPQMVYRYGAATRARRAQTNYDRIMGSGM